MKPAVKASRVCKWQLSTEYMAQMKRNCLTEETVKGFLKTEFH